MVMLVPRTDITVAAPLSAAMTMLENASQKPTDSSSHDLLPQFVGILVDSVHGPHRQLAQPTPAEWKDMVNKERVSGIRNLSPCLTLSAQIHAISS